jgi:signal transduction protein with GAF and PtsI domain
MVLEGAGGEIGLTPPGDVKAAMMATLRPEQRAAYEAEQLRRREAAQKDAQAIGLTLPADWEMLTESF